MALWSLAILLVSVAYINYRYPPTQLEPIFRFLRPGRRRQTEEDEHETSAGSSPPGQPSEEKQSDIKIDVAPPSETETTPKATPSQPETAVPSLSLNDDTPEEPKQDRQPKSPVPLFPSANSAQRASNTPQPPKPNVSPTQMPPPPKPSSMAPPTTPASLRVPSTGPLPNRGPPPTSQQRLTTNTLSPTTASTIPKARGKVLLAPGHSPMDWAALTRSSANLSGVDRMQRVTPSTLKTMTGRKGKPAWTSWQGKVYNLTPYLPFHPGGEGELMRAAGRDGTRLFLEVHPWVNWENMLGTCFVGVMVAEDEGLEGLD